jgi:hypothetical protein
MENKKMILVWKFSDSGFCRSYYKHKESGVFYCVQYGIRPTDDVDLYVCSDDGEPVYRARTDNKSIQRPPIGTDSEDFINAFIDKIEKTENVK